MTLNKLIKALLKLQASGAGRYAVCVHKPSLDDQYGDYSICGVESVSDFPVPMVDGDGFTINNKDGSERMRSTVVLNGSKE